MFLTPLKAIARATYKPGLEVAQTAQKQLHKSLWAQNFLDEFTPGMHQALERSGSRAKVGWDAKNKGLYVSITQQNGQKARIRMSPNVGREIFKLDLEAALSKLGYSPRPTTHVGAETASRTSLASVTSQEEGRAASFFTARESASTHTVSPLGTPASQSSNASFVSLPDISPEQFVSPLREIEAESLFPLSKTPSTSSLSLNSQFREEVSSTSDLGETQSRPLTPGQKLGRDVHGPENFKSPYQDGNSRQNLTRGERLGLNNLALLNLEKDYPSLTIPNLSQRRWPTAHLDIGQSLTGQRNGRLIHDRYKQIPDPAASSHLDQLISKNSDRLREQGGFGRSDSKRSIEAYSGAMAEKSSPNVHNPSPKREVDLHRSDTKHSSHVVLDYAEPLEQESPGYMAAAYNYASQLVVNAEGWLGSARKMLNV